MICKCFLSQTASKAKLADAMTKADAEGGVICHSPIVGQCDLIVDTLIVTSVHFRGVIHPVLADHKESL